MSTRRERILQKLNPVLLKITPKLSGSEGSIINLNSKDSLEDGAKKLMMRFFRNQDLCEKSKRNSIQNDSEVTILSAKYNESEEISEVITEKLSLPFERNDEPDLSERPGQRLQKLKIQLQEKMSAKWEKEYKKRINNSKSFEIKYKRGKKSDYFRDKSYDTEDEDESTIISDGGKKSYEVENSNDGNEVHGESEVKGKESDMASAYNLGQDDEKLLNKSSREKTPEKNNVYYDDDETLSLVPAYQPGGGLLYGGSELTQNDEELLQNLMSPSLKLRLNESPGSKMQSQNYHDRTPKKDSSLREDGDSYFAEKKKLFSQKSSNSFDLYDAFEFCSGKFPGNSKVLPDATYDMNKLYDKHQYAGSMGTQNVAEENLVIDVSDDEVDDDDDDDESKNKENYENDSNGNEEVENSFDENLDESEPRKDVPKTRKNIVAFEDSEDEDEKKEGESKKTESEAHNRTEEANSLALKFLSDDEDEAVVADNNDTKVKKINRKILHFSDEEDEGNEEVDDAADSDEESEEEDARSIHYDSEENEITNPREFFEKEAELSGSEYSGDEDERGLDEFDFEEGDADHLDNSQVRSQLEKIHIRRLLDDDAREVRLIQEILFEDGDLHSDGKRRDRKFKWKNLGTFEEQENDHDGKEGGNESEDDGIEEERQRRLRYEKELFLMAKKKNGGESSDDEIMTDVQVIKVMRVKATEKAEDRSEKIKAVTRYTEISKNSLFSNARGSFLTRNEEFLSRLAKVTAGVGDSVLGARNSRNFVFATKSPEKSHLEGNAASKRRTEDVESCGRVEKRAKVLPTEVHAGPSILDLLV